MSRRFSEDDILFWGKNVLKYLGSCLTILWSHILTVSWHMKMGMWSSLGNISLKRKDQSIKVISANERYIEVIALYFSYENKLILSNRQADILQPKCKWFQMTDFCAPHAVSLLVGDFPGVKSNRAQIPHTAWHPLGESLAEFWKKFQHSIDTLASLTLSSLTLASLTLSSTSHTDSPVHTHWFYNSAVLERGT